MYRTLIKQLYEWKNDKYRKPLIIRGARQVGKTWLMQTFGAEAYVKTLYINCDRNPRIQRVVLSRGFLKKLSTEVLRTR